MATAFTITTWNVQNLFKPAANEDEAQALYDQTPLSPSSPPTPQRPRPPNRQGPPLLAYLGLRR